MRITLSILFLLSVALGAPTVHGAAGATATGNGCGCAQDAMAACAMDCCAGDAMPAGDDVEELCDCGLTEAVPVAPAVPTPFGSEKPIRDVAHEPAPRIADASDVTTVSFVSDGPAPPRLDTPASSDLCVWRN